MTVFHVHNAHIYHIQSLQASIRSFSLAIPWSHLSLMARKPSVVNINALVMICRTREVLYA